MAQRVSHTDLESALARWQDANVISAEQANQIRALEAPEPDAGFREPAQILTWLGGFLALVATAVFIGIDWNNMGAAQQTMWAALAIAGSWGLAWFLRRKDDPIRIQVSNVLVIAGTLLIMLLAYSMYRLTGLWPERPSAPASQRTTNDLMGVAQVVTAIVAVYWAFRLRVSWMLLPAGFVGWIAWMAWMDHFREATDLESEFELLRLSLYGVLLVLAGLIVARLGWKHHATWLFLVGLTINLIMLGIRSFEDPMGLNALIFLAMTLIAIALGLISEMRIFLIYGAIGLYGWLSALVIETFGGSRPVAFALILVGALIVVAGVAWQRFHHPGQLANGH